jgi:hypothetical protein
VNTGNCDLINEPEIEEEEEDECNEMLATAARTKKRNFLLRSQIALARPQDIITNQ